MVTWHGLSDPLIMTEGAADHGRGVEGAMGGA
jgi:hypothetical protein